MNDIFHNDPNLFSNEALENETELIPLITADTIYAVPISLEESGLGDWIVNEMQLPVTRDPEEGLAKWRTFVDDIRGWNQKCNRLHIWDYVINYAHCVQPFPNLRVLQPNIRFFIENGVTGIYEEANYFSRGGEMAELRTYLMAKALWEPGYDTEKGIDEFVAAFSWSKVNTVGPIFDLKKLDWLNGHYLRALTADELADPATLSTGLVDVLVLPYGSSFPAMAAENLREFLRTGGHLLSVGGYPLDRLLALDLDVICPGHGPLVSEPRAKLAE